MKDYDRNKITPILSVVIPTLGRPILVRTLNSLIQTKGFPQLEVLIAGRIASGQVLDEVHRLLAEHPQLRHLPVSFAVGDSSEKKNAGWRASRADLVAFLDDDVVVAADWAQHMLASFDRPEIALVSGPGLVPRDVSWMTRLAGSALASKAAGYVSERYLQGQVRPRAIRWSRIIGCNMVYRKKILEAIGGFDPKFWPGEEMVAAFRTEKAGYQLMFNPEAYVFHYPRQTFGHFIRQIYGYGATRVRLIRSGVDPEPVTLVPALWVLSLAVLGVGGGFSAGIRLMLGVDIALYLLADLWITVSKFRETRQPLDLLLFLLVPAMHISYGLAEWIEFFRPGRDLSVHKEWHVT